METATEAPVLTLDEHVRDRLDAALAGIRISCQEEAIPGPNIIQACVSEPVEAYPVREDKIPELADRLADALTKTLLNRGKKLSPKQELICWPGEINHDVNAGEIACGKCGVRILVHKTLPTERILLSADVICRVRDIPKKQPRGK